MIKTSTIFILLILQCFLSYSQSVIEYSYSDTMSQSDSDQRLFGGILASNDHIDGNQYFMDWSLGDIKLNNGGVIHNKKIRYNGFLDELIWMEGINMVKLEKPIIDEFTIGDPKMVFKKMKVNDPLSSDSSEIFMQVLYVGKLSVFAYRRIKQVEKEVVENSKNNYVIDKISPKYIYYIQLPNKKLASFSKIRRHSLISIFAQQKSGIRKLLRQNHQPLKNETDLIEAVKLIQTILL